MTLDELLKLATAVERNHARRPEEIDEDDGQPVTFVRERLARGVIELLGAAQPCGVEPFEVHSGWVLIGDTNALEVGGKMSPAAAREHAAMLLRAADEAER